MVRIMMLVFALLAVNMWQIVTAGIYSQGGHGGGGGAGGGGGFGGGNANSFSYFTGPVVGPAQAVIVKSAGSGGFGGFGGHGGFRGAGGNGAIGGAGNHGGFGGAGGHGGFGNAGSHGGFGVAGGHGFGGGVGENGVGGGQGGPSIDFVAYPSYNYGYGVTDFHTGDAHSQQESRDGDTVVGHYSLQEPGGNVRTVKYVADNNGFQTQVHNSAGNNHAGANQGGYGGHGGGNNKGW